MADTEAGLLPGERLSNTDFDADFYYGKYQLAYYDQQTFGPSATS